MWRVGSVILGFAFLFQVGPKGAGRRGQTQALIFGQERFKLSLDLPHLLFLVGREMDHLFVLDAVGLRDGQPDGDAILGRLAISASS